MVYIAVLISIVSGLFIELFFRLIRYSDEASNRLPVAKYRPYNNYLTTQEFVAGGKRRWWKYIMFRSSPPAIVFVLLVSILQRYFVGLDVIKPLILCALVFLLPRDISNLIRGSVTFAEKSVHIINIIFVAILIVTITYLSEIVSFASLAPSREGTVDNLWTSLFVAALIVLYLDATNHTDNSERDAEQKENLRSNYIVATFQKLQEKFGASLWNNCQNQKCSEALLYAILIHENMNRPAFVRVLENVLVRLLPVELTVGIAQVKSNKPLKDEESIEIAAKILKESRNSFNEAFSLHSEDYTDVKKIIKKYNSDESYIDSVIQIVSTLKTYAPDTFNE